MNSILPTPSPYAAPQAPLSPATDPRSWSTQIVGEWKRGAWPLVFLLNLGVPVLLGFALCSNVGRVGVVLVTALLLGFTTWLVASRPLLRARWIAGGRIVAVFQLIPFFHFIIGSVSIFLLSKFDLLSSQYFDDNFDPFGTVDFLPALLLTLMVGGGLLAFAFLLGIRQVSVEEENQIKFSASTSS
jgi:hypothetical protein